LLKQFSHSAAFYQTDAPFSDGQRCPQTTLKLPHSAAPWI